MKKFIACVAIVLLLVVLVTPTMADPGPKGDVLLIEADDHPWGGEQSRSLGWTDYVVLGIYSLTYL